MPNYLKEEANRTYTENGVAANDEERYLTFLNQVQNGDAKRNAFVSYSYEVVAPFLDLNNGLIFMRQISVCTPQVLNMVDKGIITSH